MYLLLSICVYNFFTVIVCINIITVPSVCVFDDVTIVVDEIDDSKVNIVECC